MSKLILLFGTILLLTATLSVFSHKSHNEPLTPELMAAFKAWKSYHNKAYKSENEEIFRMQVFANNYELINTVNSMNSGVTYKMNQFGDLTRDEFASIYLGTIEDQLADGTEIVQELGSLENLGDIDWRTKGAVQKVKNQGQCGSCWAFSTVAVTESAYAVAKKGLQNLAEQQLVDCARPYGNYGCNGGWPSKALKYVQDKGLTDESKYPYTAKDGQCKVQSGSYKVRGQQAGNNCNALQAALNKQPVSVCVDATNWQFYSGGIFSNCSTRINHAVLAVGYNSQSWIIKNSWGTGWGEQGYIRLKAGNTCAVCQVAVWPSV